MKFFTKSGRQIHYYNEGNEKIDSLFNKLLHCYSLETTYDKGKKNYDYDNNPTYGQCGVSAMIFQDLFGGTIHKINYLLNETHYFNYLNGQYYDLTSDQFSIYNIIVNYELNEEIDRNDLESKLQHQYMKLKERGYKMKTYLITGGAGFIGSTLTKRLLKEGNKVIVIDNFNDYYNPSLKEENVKEFENNSDYKLYRGDIRNRNDIKRIMDENTIDVIVHLAAMAGVRPSIEDPILYQEVNGLGTQNILEEAKLHKINNLVMASSSSVYGNCKEVPFKEDMIVDFAISPYAATKKANEVMAHVYHKLNNMNIIMLRFFTVYGPKQRPDLAINKFTRLMLNNEEIPMYGDGSTSRDYTYVDDIVDGIIKSCDYVMNNNNVYEIINLGSNNPISLKEMINTIGEVLNIEPKIKEMPMQPGDVDRTYADITKARELLKYNPSISFKDGIKKFVDWYKN